MAQLGYQHADLVAAKKLIDIHIAKLDKAIVLENYAEACSALRAVQDNCNHALQVSARLSLHSHLHNDQRR